MAKAIASKSNDRQRLSPGGSLEPGNTMLLRDYHGPRLNTSRALVSQFPDTNIRRNWDNYYAHLPYNVPNASVLDDPRILPGLRNEAKRNHADLHNARNFAETIMMAEIRSRNVFNLVEIAPGSSHRRRREQLINWERAFKTDPSYTVPPTYKYLQPHLSAYDYKYLRGSRKFKDVNQGLVRMERFSEETVANTQNLPKGAYFLGNVCYYLNKQEWLAISESAVMGIYVHCMFTKSAQGCRKGVEWTSKSGQYTFMFDDNSAWSHAIDWLERLQLTTKAKLLWEEQYDSDLHHELWYIAPKSVVDFMDYDQAPIGYISPDTLLERDDDFFSPTAPTATRGPSPKPGPIIPRDIPSTCMPGFPSQVAVNLPQEPQRQQAQTTQPSPVSPPPPIQTAQTPQPPVQQNHQLTPEPAVQGPVQNPQPPPVVPEPPQTLGAALLGLWTALVCLAGVVLNGIPFMDVLSSLRDGFTRKWETEWRPFSDVSHYIHPKSGTTEEQLRQEFPSEEERTIANKIINISLVQTDPITRASHLQTLSRTNDQSAANVVDIAMRCEPHIRRARERLNGEGGEFISRLQVSALLGVLFSIWCCFEIGGKLVSWPLAFSLALLELLRAIPLCVGTPILGLGVSWCINKKRFVPALLLTLFTVLYCVPNPASWSSRHPFPSEPEVINEPLPEVVWRAYAEAVIVSVIGWPALLFSIFADIVVWKSVSFPAISIHMTTYASSRTRFSWLSTLVCGYFHAMYNIAAFNDYYRLALFSCICPVLVVFLNREYKWGCFCGIVVLVAYLQMSISLNGGFDVGAETLMDDVLEDTCYYYCPGWLADVRVAMLERLGNERIWEWWTGVFLGYDGDTAETCDFMRTQFSEDQLRRLGEAFWSLCYGNTFQPAQYVHLAPSLFIVTVWSFTRSWGRAVSPLIDLYSPSPYRGLEIAPVCMGNTSMAVRPGAKGKAPMGKCGQNSIGYQLAGPRLSMVTISSHKGCSCNTWRAMVHRMAGLPKRYQNAPSDVLNDNDAVSTNFRRVWREILPRLKRGVPQQPDARAHPSFLTHWEWDRRYPRALANKLRVAYVIGSESTTYSTFVKKEKLMLSRLVDAHIDPLLWEHSVDGFVNSTLNDPRGISVPPPAQRYANGPEADFYNKTIMRKFNGQVFYACGSTPEVLGRWSEWVMANFDWGLSVMGDDVVYLRNGPLGWSATSLDISRYDQHIRQCHLKASFSYMRFVGVNLLRRNMERSCFPRKYHVKHPFEDGYLMVHATRASGDPDTISSNSLITIAIAWWAAEGNHDMSQAFYDCGFIVTGGTKPFVSGHWDFLQKIFYPANTSWGGLYHPAPKVGRFVARAFWSSVPYAPVNRPAYCRGVALSLQKDFNHVPIARALVERILYLTEGKTPIFDAELKRSMEFGNFSKEMSHLNPAVYTLFEERYGVSKADCDLVESRISKLSWDEFVDDPKTREIWERIVTIDM
jgi:hypothetical protein